jgi:ABC-type polysaccharide/polyol phosphate export permease
MKSAAARRYNRSVLWLSVAYVVLLLTVALLFKHHRISGLLAYIAAVLPAVPIIGIFGAIGRFITEETDEYQRMLLIRQTLVATGFALTVATVWGFLESFGLVGHADGYYAAVLWFGGLGLGSCVNRWWERRA